MKKNNPTGASIHFRQFLIRSRCCRLTRSFLLRKKLVVLSTFGFLILFGLTDSTSDPRAQQPTPVSIVSDQGPLVSDNSELKRKAHDSSLAKQIALLPVRLVRSVAGLFKGEEKRSSRPVTDSATSTQYSRLNIVGTIRNRVIHLHASTRSEEAPLELVQIEVGAKSITLGEPFEADGNWLRDLKVAFRNVSSEPIAYFTFGGGLIFGVDEELKTFESYEEGISWKFGRYLDPEREKQKGITLRPGEIVHISYEDVDPHYKGASEAQRGAFCKLVIGPPVIQFEDGTLDSSSKISFRLKVSARNRSNR